MLSPADRVIMISGANRGIGRAVARRLHGEGYSVSLGARDPAALAQVTAEITPERVLAHAYQATDRGSARAWVAATVERFGRVDGVVANAGVAHAFGVEDGEEAALDEMWEVNAKGPYRLINAAFPHLKACGSGRIVTVVSLSGKRVKSAGIAGYAMSKFAALALTHAARMSGWAHGIRATALCPGFVATDMTADVADPPPARMIDADDLAVLVATVIALPNSASVAELPVNCVLEHSY